MYSIQQGITTALTGGPTRTGRRWKVTGINSRGEHFTIDRYRTRHDADDFAREVRANGGTATVASYEVTR